MRQTQLSGISRYIQISQSRPENQTDSLQKKKKWQNLPNSEFLRLDGQQIINKRKWKSTWTLPKN